MGTFGRYLLERGAVSGERLEEATQVLVVFGGRLGTVLVESGALTLEEVERHLSAHLGVPAAPLDRLHEPHPDALAAIPKNLVDRYRVFPMWREKRTLHVAMSDPQNPNQIDELAFATSLSITPYVVAELRLAQLLERYYQIRPDSRFTDHYLLEMAGHVRPRKESPLAQGRAPRRQQRSPARDDDEQSRQREDLGIGPLEEGEELSRNEDFEERSTDTAALESGSGRAAVAPTPDPSAGSRSRPLAASSPAEVSELESQLVQLATPKTLPTLVLRIAAFHARAVAFFGVRRGTIRGLLAAGDMAGSQVEHIEVPLSAPSVLSRPVRDGTIFLGPPGSKAADRDLLRGLGREPRELIVLPIHFGERTASLLYADNRDAALAETSIAALEALCEITSGAYERLLVAGRKHL
jgi:hypothetical protein